MKRGTSSSSYDTPASPQNPNKQRIRVKGQEYVWLDEIKAGTCALRRTCALRIVIIGLQNITYMGTEKERGGR